jgi:ATP-dependent helicase HrpB
LVKEKMKESNLTQIIASTALPLVPYLPAICGALEENGSVVIRADPGSGKSTLVPLALIEHFKDKVIMLEPRRAAVLGITQRIAELLGEDIGKQVGYAVRLERKVSAQTRIEIITEGLLVRRLQENPSMFEQNQIPLTIIFDEFHERSIHTDLAFAFVMDLRRMGAGINIVIMSATMDANKVAGCIDSVCTNKKSDTKIIECPGRVFPVEISYRPLPQKTAHGQGFALFEFTQVLADILNEEKIHASNCNPELGDVLVFLPGRREIEACAEFLEDRGLDRHFEIKTLHGSLPLSLQRNIIIPGQRGDKRRVILSTNVAETGLTIPGIKLVVDSGYVRIQRFHIPSGMNRLLLEPVSCNSAEQRAGRAGRLGPGRCIRLWAKAEARLQETTPEISRIDITAAVLECLLWGVKNLSELPWLEKPPQAAWNSALELLEKLGAVDADCRPTGAGIQIARLGLDTRLGRLCIAGRDLNMLPIACVCAAILSERSSIDKGHDFTSRLSLLRLNTGSKTLRPWALRPWAQRVMETAADLAKRLGHSLPLQWDAGDETGIGPVVAAAFPDRIARQINIDDNIINKPKEAAARLDERIFRFPSGREARCTICNAQWLCALEVDSGERMGFIQLAVPVSGETAFKVLDKQITVETAVEWNGLVPRLTEEKKAGRILLAKNQRPCRRNELLPCLSDMLKEQGLSVLPWNENRYAAMRLLARIRFFVKHQNDKGYNWDNEFLVNEAAEWLGPFIWDGNDTGKGSIINTEGLYNALVNRLGWENMRKMEKLAPGEYTLPDGRKRHIDYDNGEPVLRLRLQDAFGIHGKCDVMGIPIVFHLLSPAGRPVQVTSDLAGFWAGSYAELRKEMRGRYPKHKWPEDPAVSI